MGIALWIAAWVALWFFYKFCLSTLHPYEGRHHLNNVKEVPQTYHPSDNAWTPVPVKNRAWWNARMTRLHKASYLFVALPELWNYLEAKGQNEYQQWLDWVGTNYRWESLPLSLWPDSWKVPESINLSKCVAGSDLPPRALKVVESLKPFNQTIAARLAA